MSISPSFRPINSVSFSVLVRPLLALVTLFALFIAGCGVDSSRVEHVALDSPAWLNAAMATPLGQTFDVGEDDEASHHTMHALGFAKLGQGKYVHQVDMLSYRPLLVSRMAELPEIDTVAVLSINRKSMGDEQYIYPTLRSLFGELPKSAYVNILVGNDDTAYLEHATLARQIGEDAANRVVLIHTSSAITQFWQKEEVSTGPRAAWNYSRALRSYVGTKHLLLLEDDVTLTQNGLAHLRPYLQRPVADVIALYNDRCDRVDVQWIDRYSPLQISRKFVRRSGDFPTLQAMLYNAMTANDAGTYLVSRAGRESHDYMLGRFFAKGPDKLGYVKPSIAQHEGRTTTGLSGADSIPYSECFVPVLAPIP
jgi:hypothetical protein